LLDQPEHGEPQDGDGEPREQRERKPRAHSEHGDEQLVRGCLQDDDVPVVRREQGVEAAAFLFFAATGHPAALAFGIGALLALERDTRRRNALACGLLVCGVLVFTLAVAFVVGAAVVILVVRRRPQLWIPAVPAAAFALWRAFYGHRQPSEITVTHIARLPRYVLDAVSAGLASATGLAHPSLPAHVSSSHALTLIVFALLSWWLLRGGRPRPLVFAARALAFWALTGASAIVGRGANSSRYQITSVVLVILLVAELLRGLRLSRTGLTLVSLTAVAVVASNLVLMRRGYDFMRVESQTAQADLGALQLARDVARRICGCWLR
jgi:hypothetical protein